MALRRWLLFLMSCVALLLWSATAWADGMGGLYFSALGRAVEPLLIAAALALPIVFICGIVFVWRSWQFLSGRAEAPRGLGKTPRSYYVLGGLLSVATVPLMVLGGFMLLLARQGADYVLSAIPFLPTMTLSLLLFWVYYEARQRKSAV